MTNSQDTMQVADVLRLKPQDDAEVETKAKEIQAFDDLYARYAELNAKFLRGVPDDESDRLSAELDNVLWKIIRTPAPASRHVDEKLEILREIMKTEWTDCRREALIESIRNDVVE